MTIPAEAWFLHAGDKGAGRGELVRETFQLSEPTGDQVVVEPLYGCWEGNMGHALDRRPIDVCRARGEERVVLGNAGVVRVLVVGPDVRGLEPGQVGLLYATDVADAYGYPIKVVGYDAPGTMGCLATRFKLRAEQVIPVPEKSRHSLAQWGAFGVRYVTAWANWRVAYGTFRLQVAETERAKLTVWGWGGGTTLAELHLARLQGHQGVMLSSNAQRLQQIEKAGLGAVDRSRFGELAFDEKRFKAEPEYREAYKNAEEAFLSEVKRLTGGDMVNIFVDCIGGPVHRATLAATSREGVITTMGWKAGMNLSYVRAIECIARRQHIHTHYARRQEVCDAVEYAERTGWMPRLDEDVTPYDRIPELAARFASGDIGMFPVYSVAV